ncbi:MAG: cytochrome c3 family protein [Desulfuromonadaceae bacterium]
MLKKITVAIALTGLMAGAAYAGINAGEGITGSLHDMNYSRISGTPDEFKRACVFCHTPHNAKNDKTYTTNAPLWNRVDTTLTAPTPYTWAAPANAAYEADGKTPKILIGDPLLGPTRLCMGCHDGSIAVDSHGSKTGLIKMPTTSKAYVKDLTITHPIGFDYDAAYAARGVNELIPSTGHFITGAVGQAFKTQAADRPAALTAGGKLISDTLYGGTMTCASCHEVHNTNNAKPVVPGAYNYFLRAQEEGSAICLSCHIK